MTPASVEQSTDSKKKKSKFKGENVEAVSAHSDFKVDLVEMMFSEYLESTHNFSLTIQERSRLRLLSKQYDELFNSREIGQIVIQRNPVSQQFEFMIFTNISILGLSHS